MIQSMTGFGRGEVRTAAGTLVLEARSVNHRFLEVVTHVPAWLTSGEDQLRDGVKTFVHRGRVTVSVAFRPEGAADQAAITLDWTRARRYHALLSRLKRTLSLPDPVTLDQLLRLPELVTVERALPDPKRLMPGVERALHRAMRELVSRRAREGRAVQQELRRYVREIRRAVRAIQRRVPVMVRRQRRSLQRKLREAATPLDPQRLNTEVALFAANTDISEELSRMLTHLTHLESLLTAKTPAGRQLDFIAQELFREATTVGAKIDDIAMTNATILIKSHVEKIREQAQNVE